MAEPLFNIFGDHFVRQTAKIVRQPLTTINNENVGKTVSSGPVKPNEPTKKIGDIKKSFLSNKGKALQNSADTPVRQVFTPRAINAGLIYNDGDEDVMQELKFTKPKYNYDNYHTDALDYLPSFEPKLSPMKPPATPPPAQRAFDMEFDCSYEDDFFTDLSCDSILDFEIDVPDV